ncbi:hypothetical protein D7X30_16545 [Corallococcus sp. AB011P]|uniref:hypothetical protein n=1 Tax=Corallococcus sp. AB011P TaxID=2316735 RepID=UPI000EA2DA10|nr:hypothetical protein [Corallococcus sp. AB011P]RKG58091.1 hypothetical protein D7X30_16545 [Corallococcus sp. AB011P]
MTMNAKTAKGHAQRSGAKHLKPEFAPRPEAQAYSWGELLEPMKKATWELIRWLDSACHATASTEQEGRISTSVLLSGDRGAGKTTVLLSAAAACQGQGDFLKRASSRDEAPIAGRDEIKLKLDEIRRKTLWLETLDLEPLPRETNLLATVLVRIRSAVEERLGPRDQGHERPLLSLLDEDGQNPWNELDQLIQDAAFIWEDLAKPDRRMQGQQQIKSAEIYTTFRTRFTRVMDAIIKAVSQREFGRSDHSDVFLVLPVDNVDRSVDHVSWMLIVTQLVSSRWLWFVLAASRSDLQALLERGYQKELAGGNRGEEQASQGLYDAQTIARRQAASTLRRELPPLQRITSSLSSPCTHGISHRTRPWPVRKMSRWESFWNESRSQLKGRRRKTPDRRKTTEA